MLTILTALRTDLGTFTPTEPCEPATVAAIATDPCVWGPGDPCRFALTDLAWSSSAPAWFITLEGAQ